jgi:uncharacterized protein YjbJ (UPF0337 family)
LKQKTLVSAEVTANRAKWKSSEGKIKEEWRWRGKMHDDK